jgi:kynurenine formamidase
MSTRDDRLNDRRGFIRQGAVAATVALGARTVTAATPEAGLRNLRILDLSVPIEHDAPGEIPPRDVEYIDHKQGSVAMQNIFGCTAEDLIFSEGDGWAWERVNISSHTGTHVDAPYHYGASSGGKPALTIDEVPLDWFFGPGVLLDMRMKEDGELITVDDLVEALAKIKYRLRPLDIVIIHTGAAEKWGTKKYFEQPGLGRESTLWLVEQGIKVIGIDAWTLDRPLKEMKKEFMATGNGEAVWPAHFAGITKEYCQIEKLANLERLPGPLGFYISCLPVKIKRASAGWCRAVALIPDNG